MPSDGYRDLQFSFVQHMLCSGAAFVTVGALRPGWLGRTLKENAEVKKQNTQGRVSLWSSDAQLLPYIEISSNKFTCKGLQYCSVC